MLRKFKNPSHLQKDKMSYLVIEGDLESIFTKDCAVDLVHILLCQMHPHRIRVTELLDFGE